MLISRNLHKKSRGFSIKTKSTSALLSFKGQTTMPQLSQANKTIKHCEGCVIYQMMKLFSDQPLSIQFLKIFHPLPYNRKKKKTNVMFNVLDLKSNKSREKSFPDMHRVQNFEPSSAMVVKVNRPNRPKTFFSKQNTTICYLQLPGACWDIIRVTAKWCLVFALRQSILFQ